MTVVRFLVLAVAFAAAVSTPAFAHVTVAPKTVAVGSTATIVFRCPNERNDTGTVKLVVQLPAEAPFASVTVPPVAGWHSSVALRTLTTPLHTAHGDVASVVDTVTWEGGTIAPGQVGHFAIELGPLPAAPTALSFKAVQTYADGEVVRWIEPHLPGQPEPPFPAPLLQVVGTPPADEPHEK